MAVDRLTATKVAAEISRKVKKPGMFHDGGGLYLQIARGGSAAWVFRFKSPAARKMRDMGLGSAQWLSLKDAREKAIALRVMVKRDGRDPIVEREKANKSGLTFRAQFEYMDKLEPRLKWRVMLDLHAFPVIGDKRVEDITTADVTGIIAGLLNAGKFETARKLQQRMQAVIRSAKGSIDTPAHKAYICHTLRSFKKVKKNKPYPSLDYAVLPAFIRKLRARPEMAARALEFAILTACRTGDIIGVSQKGLAKPPLRWSDIDLRRKVWTVPAVKTADDHNPEPFEVPLSDAAIAVLQRVKAMDAPGDMVFPSEMHPGQPMAVTAMRRQIIRRLHPGITAHGFRTTFRTWAGEKTSVERDVIETALAHKVFSRDKAEAAYKSKTTFFDKRKALMARWGEYATGASKVVKLKAA